MIRIAFFFRLAAISGCFLLFARAASRDLAWAQVADAVANNQPKTAIERIKPVEVAAFADNAYPEALKALLLRVRMENGLWFDEFPFPVLKTRLKREPEPEPDLDADPFAEPPANEDRPDPEPVVGLLGCVRQVELEMPGLPERIRPLLKVCQACWLEEYYGQQSGDWRYRDETIIVNEPEKDFDQMATWNRRRVLREIDRCWREAVAAGVELKAMPVGEWSLLFRPGTLGDSLRPTLYDVIAHAAVDYLEFHQEFAREDALRVMAVSPVFDDAAVFLAWRPPAPAENSPKHRILSIYQELLSFHHRDKEPSAFFHCDLERIRWAGRTAEGAGKQKRHIAAIQAFITANAAHPLSADARQDEVLLLLRRNRSLDAHDSAAAGAKAFPKHAFGNVCAGIVRNMEKPTLEIHTPSAWPSGGERIEVNQSNLDHLWFRLYRWDWEPDREFLRRGIELKDRKQLTAILKNKPAYAWDAKVRATRDYQAHVEEVPSPGKLKPGSYVLVVSGRKDFKPMPATMQWDFIDVADFRMISTGDFDRDGRQGGLVVDAMTGNPLAGVEIRYWQTQDGGNDDWTSSTRTAEDGSFVIEPRLCEKASELLLVATANGQRMACRDSIRSNDNSDFGVIPGVDRKPKQNVTFFTDRSIYRPGQTIRFKGLWSEARRSEGLYGTVNNRKIEVVLQDSNQKEIAKQELTTNSLGSFSGTFDVPAVGLLGSHTIRAGDLGSVDIQVEEYKRPQFTVELNRVGDAPVIGETVEITGVVKDYTGAPITGATVRWDMERELWFSGWSAWKYQDLPPLDGMQDDRLRGTARTGKDGSFTISFPAVPVDRFDDDVELAHGYHVNAEVTAPSGETVGQSTMVSVGRSEVISTIIENGWHETGKPVVLEIASVPVGDGSPLPVGGVLKVHKLKEPGECPLDTEARFSNEDSLFEPIAGPRGWETGEMVHEVAVRTSPFKPGGKCMAKVPLDLPAGRYRAILETTDRRGRKDTAVQDLQVVDPASGLFSTQMPFFTASPNWTVNPGEEFTLLWGSGLKSVRACVEWFKDGTLIKREWSSPGRTQQVFHFTPDESLRGGFSVSVMQYGMNRLHCFDERVDVPWSNKKLELAWEHLSSKLEPGAKDTWTAVIRGPGGEAAAAELVATLYDASLDDIRNHEFSIYQFEQQFRGDSGISSHPNADSSLCGNNWNFDWQQDRSVRDDWQTWSWGGIQSPFRAPVAAWVGNYGIDAVFVDLGGRSQRYVRWGQSTLLSKDDVEFYEPPQIPNNLNTGYLPTFGGVAERVVDSSDEELQDARHRQLSQISARRNLSETAFFFPHLASGADGAVRISFTMPEGLGRWRFLGFAHDAQLRHGTLEGETITARDLMVRPDPPRFVREGDVLEFTTRVVNAGDAEQSGLARLSLTDEAGKRDLTAGFGLASAEQEFRIAAGQSKTVAWRTTVPEGSGPLRYKVLASSGKLTDGEEGWLPVLPKRVEVTDSLALQLAGPGEKRVMFEALRDSAKSTTLRHQSLRLQVVSQPAWNALLSLPWLMEYPYECAEQTFQRYYAAAIGHHLVTSNPDIRRVFEAWRNTPALASPLLRDRETCQLLMEETPWQRDAEDESQARRRVAELFDNQRLVGLRSDSLKRLSQMNAGGGLWPWFPGGEGSESITTCIAAGLGRLRSLGVATDSDLEQRCHMVMINLLENHYQASLREIRKDPKVAARLQLTPLVARALYAVSIRLPEEKSYSRLKLNDETRDFFLQQVRQHWSEISCRMTVAHLALALFREGDAATAKRITRSLCERASITAEDGMFWRDLSTDDHWRWWQSPVETQAAMIEAFSVIDQDTKAVDACRLWLLRQKRAESWPTTTGTADAICAILLDVPGAAPAKSLSAGEPLRVSLGGTLVKPVAVEPGTGSYEHRIAAAEIKPDMAEIMLSKADAGVAWAGIHWSYFEEVGKLDVHGNRDLQLERKFFLRRRGPDGLVLEPLSGKVRVGDELVSRLVIHNRMDMEFVQVKDPRGSGTDPGNPLSGRRHGGDLSYYEETRDGATHYFIDFLPAGSHVLETSVRVRHAGVYQSGCAEARCMYAPELSARSTSLAIEALPLE